MNKRNFEIDVLRGIAVIVVVFFHFNEWVPFGWMGVDLFFVISGYLVSSLIFNEYLKNGSVRILRFFIRRSFKIYPLFFIFLLLTVIIKIGSKEQVVPSAFLYESFFLRNYFGGIWVHTWSLCVEEHFYFVLVFFAFFLCNKSHFILRVKLVNAVFLSFFFMCLFFRISSLLLEHKYGSSHFFNEWARGVHTHNRIDSLLCGVFIAYNLTFNKERVGFIYKNYLWQIRIAALATFVTAIALYKDMNFKTTCCYTLLWISFGVLMLEVVLTKSVKEIVTYRYAEIFFKAIAFIGLNSYAIYLFHPMIRDYLLEFVGLDKKSCGSFLVYFSGSIVSGYLASRFVESYFLKIREKYFKQI